MFKKKYGCFSVKVFIELCEYCVVSSNVDMFP